MNIRECREDVKSRRPFEIDGKKAEMSSFCMMRQQTCRQSENLSDENNRIRIDEEKAIGHKKVTGK